MNGNEWRPEHTAILKRMAGRADAAIARATGHAVVTVRQRRAALGIPAHRGRTTWTRRDWLLTDAAVLDFQISL